MDSYISILLIALCIAISPAASRYTMEITAVSYVNPTDEDSDGGECDPEGGLCDVYFQFCVRNINTSATNDNCWPDHIVESSNDITTQNYTFPETGPLYEGAGVSNPINFTSNSAWPGSFQLLVVIYDRDTFDDDLVDLNVFNLDQQADGTTSSDMAVLGFYSKATFTARIRVSCQQGFSGDDCLTTTPSTTTTTDVTIIATPLTTTTTTDVTIVATPLTTTSSSTIIANTTSTTGTSEITSTSTMIAATPTNTTSIITSTITSTTSSSLPTTELSPNVQLFAGLGAGILAIRIILLVIIITVVVIISICCYQNRRESPPADENLQKHPSLQMSNMNPETKESSAQGHGVSTSSQ